MLSVEQMAAAYTGATGVNGAAQMGGDRFGQFSSGQELFGLAGSKLLDQATTRNAVVSYTVADAHADVVATCLRTNVKTVPDKNDPCWTNVGASDLSKNYDVVAQAHTLLPAAGNQRVYGWAVDAFGNMSVREGDGVDGQDRVGLFYQPPRPPRLTHVRVANPGDVPGDGVVSLSGGDACVTWRAEARDGQTLVAAELSVDAAVLFTSACGGSCDVPQGQDCALWLNDAPNTVFQVRVCRLGDHVDHPLSTVKPAASNLVRLSPDGIIPQIEYAASFTLAHLLNRAPAMG